MEAWVHRNGKINYQAYERGIPQGDVKEIGTTNKKGTIIKFLPDDEIFKVSTSFDYKMIVNRLRQQAYLTKGIKLIIFNEISEERYKFYFE